MKLLFKQRFFSWFDSYDIYGENGDTMYEVKGQFAWGHCLKYSMPLGMRSVRCGSGFLVFYRNLKCISVKSTWAVSAESLPFLSQNTRSIVTAGRSRGLSLNGIMTLWMVQGRTLPAFPKNYSTGQTPM